MKKFVVFGLILVILFSVGCFGPIDPKPNPPVPDENNSIIPDDPELPVQDGLSFETAIIIESEISEEGIGMEYDWVEFNACKNENGPQSVEMQELQSENDSWFDLLHVRCHNNDLIVYYFQIDSFFGKWE